MRIVIQVSAAASDVELLRIEFDPASATDDDLAEVLEQIQAILGYEMAEA